MLKNLARIEKAFNNAFYKAFEDDFKSRSVASNQHLEGEFNDAHANLILSSEGELISINAYDDQVIYYDSIDLNVKSYKDIEKQFCEHLIKSNEDGTEFDRFVLFDELELDERTRIARIAQENGREDLIDALREF